MDSLKELKSFLKALPRLNDKERENRIIKAKANFRYFVQTYLSHHLGESKKETSHFRNWVYKELPKLLAPKASNVITHNRILVKAYRGAAKTTLISRLLSLWQILRGDKRYVILISSTLDLAKEGIDLLKVELEDNANLIHDFGIKKGYVWNNEEIVFSIEQDLRRSAKILQDKFKGYQEKGEGNVLNIHDQNLSEDSLMQCQWHKSTPAKSIRKSSQLCKIKSFGAGKKIRGTNFLSMRPDLIICDDIENDENIESKLETYINNNTATNALHKIMQEVEMRNERFRRVHELWNGKDLNKTTTICKTPQLLKDIFNTEAEYISIGASVIQDHKTRHPEIDSFDYSLIADMIEDIYGIYQDEKSNVKYLVASKLGRWYRLSLKSLNDKKEIWVESLVSIRDKDTLLKKLKNKKAIYRKDDEA